MDLLKELFRRRGILEFAAAWTAIGIFGYVKVQQWEQRYDADLISIERGDAETIQLEVTDKVRRRTGDDVDYGIHLGNAVDPRIDYVRVPKRRWTSVAVGDRHIGYRVNGRVRVYAFHRGNFHYGKWASVGLMIVPGTTCLAFVLLNAIYACHRERRDAA